MTHALARTTAWTAEAGPPTRFSMASAGRAFTTEAASWNVDVLDAVATLTDLLAVVELSGPFCEPGATHATAQRLSPPALVSQRLVASWLVGVLTNQLPPDASLVDAETWFAGSSKVSAAIAPEAAEGVLPILMRLAARPGAHEMLPYALDPVRHEYRRDLLGRSGGGGARAERKERGSFFTPGDVVEHIVDVALSGRRERSRLPATLDPAVGTGVFLRCVFEHLLHQSEDPHEALEFLHGIDLMESCAEVTAFVLLGACLDSDREAPTEQPIETWQRIRSRLLAGDTLRVLDGVGEAQSLFAAADDRSGWTLDGFDLIVGNPPYARLGDRDDSLTLAERYDCLADAGPGSDVYIAFVELLCSQLRPGGAGCLVVPMSIGFSSTASLRRLRGAADRVGGDWSFEFFDRTPDALFGDDVKQRTAIVSRVAVPGRRITTSPVMRWTSRNRATLFDRIPATDLGDVSITEGVPKVGDSDEAAAYRALRLRQDRLADAVASSGRVVPPVLQDSGFSVFVAGTAYNWLTVFRDAAAITRDAEKPSTSSVQQLDFSDERTADVAYAILASRLAYWLWRVEGDAFHVPSGWLSRLPMSPAPMPDSTLARLGELGRSLWAAIEPNPVVSLNGGRTTITYCPHSAPELLDQIDTELAEWLDLSQPFVRRLGGFARDLATAGRSSTVEHGLKRALAAWNRE